MNDLKQLREVYSSNSIAKAFLDTLAERKNNASETRVERALALLFEKGIEVSRGQIVDLMRQFQDLGCGEFVTGRRGHPSRFRWSVNVISLGQAAAGETEEVEEIDSGVPADAEESINSLLKHAFHLRPDFQVWIELPTDLTEREAQRMAKFIESLPMNREHD